MAKETKCKLVLLGDTAVGKSSILKRLISGEFSEDSLPTIGAAYMQQDFIVDDWKITFNIWDTAGQEQYRSLGAMYYRGAGAALVVYDIRKMESFEVAKEYIGSVTRSETNELIIALAGNKVDEESKRRVPREVGEAYAKKNGYLFFETSAKTGLNINNVFLAIAEKKFPK